MALKHVLLARFKPHLTPEEILELIGGYEALPASIDSMKSFEWGTDVSVENLHQGFTHIFVSTFESKEGRDAYLVHPAHETYAEKLLGNLEKIVVFDYVSNK